MKFDPQNALDAADAEVERLHQLALERDRKGRIAATAHAKRIGFEVAPEEWTPEDARSDSYFVPVGVQVLRNGKFTGRQWFLMIAYATSRGYTPGAGTYHESHAILAMIAGEKAPDWTAEREDVYTAARVGEWVRKVYPGVVKLAEVVKAAAPAAPSSASVPGLDELVAQARTELERIDREMELEPDQWVPPYEPVSPPGMEVRAGWLILLGASITSCLIIAIIVACIILVAT